MSSSPPDPVHARAELRAFNRTVTERIGVLEDQYLDRGRSLALDRLLWEIGTDGAEVRGLRTGLGLDSGYLSRMLRALEHEGLIVTVASGDDSRVRRAEITDAGRAEIDILDRLSDDLADAILEPLTPSQREELLSAAATTRKLLTASAIEISPPTPTNPQPAKRSRSTTPCSRSASSWDSIPPRPAPPPQTRSAPRRAAF